MLGVLLRVSSGAYRAARAESSLGLLTRAGQMARSFVRQIPVSDRPQARTVSKGPLAVFSAHRSRAWSQPLMAAV
jgi:hypothetical protein